jgi:Pyridoxamine 5'-phosphate oxidase
MDRCHQVRMSEAELVEFLDSQRTMTCATIGPGGRPHLAGLWCVPAGGRLDRCHPTRVSSWDHRKLG